MSGTIPSRMIRHRSLEEASDLPPSSLIVGSRNRPKFLYDTVTSVLAGREVPAEIIIVDQSERPNDDIASLTTDRACHIRYIWTKTAGLSRANNLGVTAAGNEILVFTHDDVRVDPTWYGAIVRALVTFGRKTIVSGRVLPGGADGGGEFVLATKTSEVPETYRGRIDTNVLYPFNMACFRSALEVVGGFDERLGPGTLFPAAEDNDLGFRLLEAGFEIRYVPEAVLRHLAWRPARDYVRLWWSYGMGQGAFYAKHFSLSDTHMIRRMGREITANLRESLQLTAKREYRQSQGRAAYIGGMVLGAIEWSIMMRSSRANMRN